MSVLSIKKYFPYLIVFLLSLSGVCSTFLPTVTKLLQGVLCICCFFSVVKQFNSLTKVCKRLILLASLFSIFFLIYYIGDWISLYNVATSFYIIIYIAVYFVNLQNGKEIIQKSFVAIIILNLIALIYELSTGNLLVKLPEGYESFVGNKIYHFGLFPDAKMGGMAIALMAIVLYPAHNKIIVIAFLETIISGCRTSSVLMLLPFLLSLVHTGKYFISAFITLVFILIFYIGVLIDFDVNVLLRLINALNIADKGNEERLFFMERHLDIWHDKYDIIEMIFGKYSYSRSIVGNGAESFWVSTLMDGGLLTVVFYMVGFCNSPWKFQGFYNRLMQIIIFSLMIVSGIGGGIVSGYIFWYYLLSPKKYS